MSESYKPSGPCVLESGKYPGTSLEVLMFRNHWHLSTIRKEIKKKMPTGVTKSDFHRHLEWLLDRGEDRLTVITCPFCQQEKIECFSLLFSGDDFSEGKNYVSCGRCKSKLEGLAPADKRVEFLPFRLSVLNRFWPGIDQRRIINLFLWAFGLSDQRLTGERLFKFFSEPGKPSAVKV